jgi:hypothetical protein
MSLVKLAGLIAVVIATTTGCASKRSGQLGWSNADAPSVTVRNDNWLDVVVYLVRGASRFRMGTVRSTSTETFRLPSGAHSSGSPLRIMADPIGASQGYLTEPVVLGPGQRLELKVASPINVSSFAVWDR